MVLMAAPLARQGASATALTAAASAGGSLHSPAVMSETMPLEATGPIQPGAFTSGSAVADLGADTVLPRDRRSNSLAPHPTKGYRRSEGGEPRDT